ncbi:MAG: FAD-binding protein [Flavobacteriaceae bacterium]|nr:FAD-binding protein [Flavobacteriaceae bacterium]
MSNITTSEFKNHAPKGLVIIEQKDSLYHYARVISNTRFGDQPNAIAYCKNASHVQYCINFSRDHKRTFRVRSGGHQHEGMCSGNGVIIIDLSEMNEIEYVKDNECEAWIPVGKQLESVYKELEKRNQTIPGGGCQSVNVGGITHGGGWGYSIRKLGMTCDNILEAEIVLANGCIETISEHHLSNLFWSLKGGGGGNFGVVTRFKFKLSWLTSKVTSFTLTWTEPNETKAVIKKWMDLHTLTGELELNPALSSSCTMIIIDPEKKKFRGGQVSLVHGRMGGQFYGSKNELVKLLRKYFDKYIPRKRDFTLLKEVSYDVKKKILIDTHDESLSSLARHQSVVANFLNPTTTPEKGLEVSKKCGDRDLRILPNAPASTCDRPHPHKISSSFPKNYEKEDNKKMVEQIYEFLSKSCYYGDVNKYMSFHCLGGVVRENTNQSVFAFPEKPYLLQIQCWWDDISNAFTNQTRNEEYVKWVADFRFGLSPLTEGSFINFVDKDLVKNPETPIGRLKLLEIYYGEKNLKKLREFKSEYDAENLFEFEMSIPLV